LAGAADKALEFPFCFFTATPGIHCIAATSFHVYVMRVSPRQFSFWNIQVTALDQEYPPKATSWLLQSRLSISWVNRWFSWASLWGPASRAERRHNGPNPSADFC
jgi:hypothetical protein